MEIKVIEEFSASAFETTLREWVSRGYEIQSINVVGSSKQDEFSSMRFYAVLRRTNEPIQI